MIHTSAIIELNNPSYAALQTAFTTQHEETITQHIKTRSTAIRDALTTKGNDDNE